MKAAKVVGLLVALQHTGILVLEMLLWNHPVGRGVFHTTESVAALSAPLAMNQGLYNGFLAAGLLWGVLASEAATVRSRLMFFFGCVLVAGIFGGLTAIPSIALVQGGPALIGLILAWRSR